MFGTLESTCDRSARRGWTTLASFTMQALAVSLLLAISLLWVGGPPQVRWLQLSTPAAFSPQPQSVTQAARGHHSTAAAVTVPRVDQLVTPPSIPPHIANSNSDPGPPPPDLPTLGTQPGIGPGFGSTGPNVGPIPGFGTLPVAIPARPATVKPLLVSHLSEANLLKRVQPVYPPLARQARVQGTVELRAIISTTGTIENLIVVRGHPLLAAAAIEAVRQWRYRPYLLNNQPVEVETEITVNFLLSGS
jgi:protein TonB